ncbi:MAG: response regulator transcription factor [Chloroflexi bacterium]|nr:response regulator transcription factor [Chloroflexota bacterium]MBV9899319.1 response regulator transcription factor [Chloroflexota bacterium]
MDDGVRGRKLRLLVVDDHPAALGGLRLRLSREPDLAIVGEATAAEEAVRLAIQLQPDVVLADLALPDGDGIDLIGRLHELAPGLRSVILTLDDSPEQRRRAFRTGAMGFVGKHESTDVLLAAIRGWSVPRRG